MTIPMDMAMLDYQWRETDAVHDHASVGFGAGSTITESENQAGGLQVKIVNASPRHSATIFTTVTTS